MFDLKKDTEIKSVMCNLRIKCFHGSRENEKIEFYNGFVILKSGVINMLESGKWSIVEAENAGH